MLGQETLCEAGPSNNGPSLPETAIDAGDPNQDIEHRREVIDIVWRMKRPSRVTGGSCALPANASSAAIRFLPASAGIVLPAIECAASLVQAGELVKDA
ncbi:hypothetical protein XH88_27300 [Bradyrhizobium sp. CCBAU 51627]|nr:hypothetical protein [Bradyrhizobium sp. CCBAU 51627]